LEDTLTKTEKFSETVKTKIVGELTLAQYIGRKSAETRKSKIGIDGLTSSQRAAIKTKETMNKIGEDGLTSYQRNARKAAETMRNKIDPKTGLSIAKSIGLKVSKTVKTPLIDGSTIAQKIAKKVKATLNKKDENGLTGYQKSARRAAETMKNDIDPVTGFNQCKRIGLKVSKKAKELTEEGITRARVRCRKMAKTMTTVIQTNGKTIAQNRSEKAAETMKNDIDPVSGLNLCQRIALKTKEKLNIIDPNTNLTGYQKTAIKTKIKLNKTDENGLSGYIKNARRAAETMKNDIDPVTGFNQCKRIGLKSVETKMKIGEDGRTGIEKLAEKWRETMSKQDENGLDGWERAFKNGAGKHSKTENYKGILCQGNYEKHFVDLLEKLNLTNEINKPKRIFYDNKKHSYLADFQYDNVLFEIKSTWTYDSNGKNLEGRIRNNLKWQAAINQGFKIFIIWDYNSSISELKQENFKNIEDSLYPTKTELTEEMIKNIFKPSLN
jgi:hypothetical protein